MMNVCLKFEIAIEVSVPTKHWLKERVDLCFNIKKVERFLLFLFRNCHYSIYLIFVGICYEVKKTNKFNLMQPHKMYNSQAMDSHLPFG